MGDLFLGGYPAKQCPRVVHNENAPGNLEPAPIPANLQTLFDQGRAYEVEVTGVLREALGSRATLLSDDPSWEENIAATMEAIKRGDEVIVGGRLPKTGERSGAPDLLVRLGFGASTYLPVDIKNHRAVVATKTKELIFSTLSEPVQWTSSTRFCNRGSHWRDDVMQLAHYTRMLQDLGFHPGDDWLRGGIIGSDTYDDLTHQPYGITWYDLAEPSERTYSASADTGRALRTPMERYDHEFGFRIKVAAAARAGLELVRPIGTDECFECVWAEHCEQVVGPDDAGFALAHGRLRTREWQYLASRGINTLADLAALDVDAELLAGFTRNAASRQGAGSAEKALRAAVAKADLTLRGVDIEPNGDSDTWPAVPTADIEIDFDIEWDRDNRIYQYGLRIRRGTDDKTAHYDPVVSFAPLNDLSETTLADRAADKLAAIIADAERDGSSVTIFHWSPVEVSRTRRFDRLASLLDSRTLDLHAWASARFVTRKSFSIKDVAPIFGFEWGVDDAGGFSSMDKIDHARGTGADAEAARTWCLEYNESDVTAQAAIRDGLRARAQRP